MKKITLHWPGATYTPSAYEKSRYHLLIDGHAETVEGDRPPEANRSPLGPDYVRHCGGFNSDNIGVAICGMKDAVERPFDPGPYPIKQKQYEAAIILVADLCETYAIKVSRNTVFLHSEVRGRFGRGGYKWDVNWKPGMKAPGDPVEMGDAFRARVQQELDKRGRFSFWTRLRQRFERLR